MSKRRKKILIEFEVETELRSDLIEEYFENLIKEKSGEKIEVRAYPVN